MSDTPRLTALRRRLADHLAAAEHLEDRPLRDPRGGRTPTAQLLARREELHDRIDAEERTGSRLHHRISRGRSWLVRVLPLVDGLVLCWFLIGVLNVDLEAPGVTLAVAVALAVLGSVAVASWNAAAGEHLRRWKDDQGNLEWGAVDGVGHGLLLAGAATWILLAAMMYVRVGDEAYQAGGVAGPATAVVAVAFAAAIVLVNAYVLVLGFADGSPLTGELDRLGRSLGPALLARHRHRVRAERSRARITARIEAHRRVTRPVLGGGLRALPTGEDGVRSPATETQGTEP